MREKLWRKKKKEEGEERNQEKKPKGGETKEGRLQRLQRWKAMGKGTGTSRRSKGRKQKGLMQVNWKKERGADLQD